MSDISIPGVPGTGRFDTQKIIENLMSVERIPLDRLENDRTEMESKRGAWQDVNRNLSRLRDSSQSLYSFENPFNERLAISADESIVTARAERTALEEVSQITVNRLAGRDRFSSAPIDTGYDVASGNYRFGAGDREVGISFGGGSLASFARALNERAGDVVRARVIRNTEDTEVFVIESLSAGKNNTLRFLEDSAALGIDLGVIKPSNDTFRQIKIDAAAVRQLTNPISEEFVSFADKGAELAPGSAVAVPIRPGVAVEENLVMEISYEVEKIPYAYEPPDPPPGADAPLRGSVVFQGITIKNASSSVISPTWNEPTPPRQLDDLRVFSLQTGSRSVDLPDIEESDGPQTMRVALSDYAEFVSRVDVDNQNTHRKITVFEVKVFDPTTRGEYVPIDPIETASDAELLIDGIPVSRDSNEIDDLIPGVTLTLKRASENPVELSVEPDRDAVKDVIIEFVGLYNQLLTEINVLTSRSDDVIDEVTFFTDEQREDARQKLGLFQGDITLMQLKSRMQTIMMNAYTTGSGRELSLLDQIGISTNPVRGGGTLDRTRLRGYLDIEESKLDDAMERSMASVKELFGTDSDGDLLVDSGVAFAFSNYIKPYSETGGFLATRILTLSRQISDKANKIEDFERRLVRIEQDYREEYGTMQGALNSLERSSEQLRNFSSNQQ